MALAIVAYALGGLALLLWELTHTLGDEAARRAPRMRVLLGVAAGLCGYASAFPPAGALIGLSLMAVMHLGTELSLPMGWAVAGRTVVAPPLPRGRTPLVQGPTPPTGRFRTASPVGKRRSSR
ncbi:hypothetical protein KN815_21240 [Streptomyces sp. 4503]|uniref:Uncharacterized protein n=1 Tax=Streptomyces niphimycinicus TaxID=2842201 RepID=A0ABS6CHV0_9ACTN|nr:hypothetical protein [Streptomyces niphimycinicus]MBU3866498.1 hypothetical protein [Streptomyces niphimycinicus]